MTGEEAIQIGLALEIIQTKESDLAPEKQKEKITELIQDWNRSRNRLREWMEEFVKKHREDRVSEKGIPIKIWNKAYDWSRFMEESCYERFPGMVARST